MPRFDNENCKYSESFERFTMSVAQVVNCGEKLNDCGCASKCKWERVSVEVEVKACEEGKKEHIGTWFHDVSYFYFHKNSLIFSPFLSGGGGGGGAWHALLPLSFQSFSFEAIPISVLWKCFGMNHGRPPPPPPPVNVL